MALYDSPVRKRVAKAVDVVLALLVVLLVLQVWLLTTSVELWLSGHREVAIPAAAVSGALFGGGIGLILLMRKTERRVRQTPRQ